MKKILTFLIVSVMFCNFSFAQRTITGTVTDDSGLALIGANILIKGTVTGAITDIDGNFSIELSEEDDILVFSYTGYNTKEVSVGDQTTINVVLSEGLLISEVVVVGYGTSKASNLVESISTVKGDEITAIPIPGIDNLLQGKSTGVTVTSANGKPGQNAYIRVRGLTSINGNNDPLFVVDGLPVNRSVYAALNPNDIEEFSILKDAAATAIYGARASAGVVLITTKKGSSKGGGTVEYTMQFGQQQAIDDKIELMNASQKLNYELALGVRGPMTAEQRADLLKYGTDWENILVREPGLMSHNLSFSGGSEDGSYFVSLSRYDQQGLSVGSDFDNTTARLNGSYKVNDWISVDNGLSVARRNDDELRDRFNVQSPFYGAIIYNPYETIYNLDEDGEIIYDEFGDPEYNFTHQGFNIVEATRNNPEQRRWTDVIGNLGITLTPIKGLSLRVNGGYTFNNFDNEYYNLPGSILDFYVGDPDAPGTTTENGWSRDRYIVTSTAAYDFDLDDRHAFSVLAGHEFLKNDYESYSISAKGYPRGLIVKDVAAEFTAGSGAVTEFAIESYFGSIGYSLDNNLNIKATVRRDGSSRFGVNNRFGTFYAVGAGYNFADLVGNGFFDQLKLRASYGTTGNEPSELYDAIGVLDFTSYANQTASFQGNVANPDLQWETQKSTSIGVDYGFWNNRLTGSIEYYSKKAEDLLFPNQLSRTTGFTSRTDNIGDLSNRGFEAEIAYDAIRGSDYGLDFSIRYSRNKATMDRLVTSGELAEGEVPQITPDNASTSVLREGNIAFVYEMIEFSRIDPDNGDLLYFDAEGNETNAPTGDDAVILDGKSALPTFSGGFDVNAYYKGLSLTTAFTFSGGNYIYNFRRYWMNRGLNGARSNQSVTALDYWQKPGDVTENPRPNVEVEPDYSTRYLEKGDYIRLRNLRVGYQLPSNLISKLGIGGVEIFASGSNLLTITDFIGDPEVGVFLEESVNTTVQGDLPGELYGFSYPNIKSFTGGVSVRF